jgi:hypothetical protein
MEEMVHNLANKLCEVLHGNPLDIAIPALAVVMAQAYTMNDTIPLNELMAFLERTINQEETTRH